MILQQTMTERKKKQNNYNDYAITGEIIRIGTIANEIDIERNDRDRTRVEEKNDVKGRIT